MAEPSSSPLWRHPDFARLWVGDTVSQFGTQVSTLALPVLAVTVLHAGPAQMGALTATATVGFLVVGLPAGAWVDRWRKRRVLIVGDLVRATAFGSVPLVWAFGALTLAQLYLVAVTVGLASVFFDVAYQSYLPALVPADRVMDGNAKLQASQSVAQVAGPAAAGALLRVVAAPVLIGVDAVSYLCSAVFLQRIGATEPGAATAGRRGLLTEIGEGLSFVLRDPLLRRIAACTSIANFFSSMQEALLVLFVLRTLHLSTAVIGIVYAAGAVGGLVGALLAGRLADGVGQGRLIPLSIVSTSWLTVSIPACVLLAPVVPPVLLLAAGNFGVFAGVVVYNIAQVSFRQRLCPPGLLGRMNASMRFLVWGTLPIGALLGGVLGGRLGIVATLWIAAVGAVLATLPVALSPLWRIRDLPRLQVAPAGPAGP